MPDFCELSGTRRNHYHVIGYKERLTADNKYTVFHSSSTILINFVFYDFLNEYIGLH